MGRFRFNFEWGNKLQHVERDADGNWWYEIFSSKVNSKTLSDKQKLDAILTNPALLKVFKLNCDMFSLGKVNNYKNENSPEIDFLYSIKKTPNLRQNWTQFFWDYMFWKMTGTAYLWRSNDIISESTQLYWLNPGNIDWSNGNNRFSKFLFSLAGKNQELKENIKYKNEDGTTLTIPLKQITAFFDLSNGISGNWYKGNSAIDALYKVIFNSEEALNAKRVNLEFSQKFFVTGNKDKGVVGMDSIPMSEQEKNSIEDSVRGNKKVHATKTDVNIKRFVDDIARLKLDESFYSDYFLIGSIYGIPRDVLEANLRGSTYENQEKATARHVEYSLKPSGQLLTDTFEALFGFESLKMEWSHLLFNQVFEKEKADRQTVQLDNIAKAKELGLSDDEVKKMMLNVMNS